MTRIETLPPKPAVHAALMDGMYRYQRHIYDVTRKYYLFGRDTTIRNLELTDGGTLLEVGCGTGRNLVLANQYFPKAALYGFDISDEMLTSARATFARKGLTPQLRVADATTFSVQQFGVAGFDRILISYALSMIPDWTAALDAAIGSLSPGGQLHIIDFGQQERLPAPFRHMLQSWLRKFHVTPRSDLRLAVEERARKNGADCAFHALGGGYAWQLTYCARL